MRADVNSYLMTIFFRSAELTSVIVGVSNNGMETISRSASWVQSKDHTPTNPNDLIVSPMLSVEAGEAKVAAISTIKSAVFRSFTLFTPSVSCHVRRRHISNRTCQDRVAAARPNRPEGAKTRTRTRIEKMITSAQRTAKK